VPNAIYICLVSTAVLAQAIRFFEEMSVHLGERQNESYPPLASLDPPVGRVNSLSRWESRPERQERVCVTLVVFKLPVALPSFAHTLKTLSTSFPLRRQIRVIGLGGDWWIHGTRRRRWINGPPRS